MNIKVVGCQNLIIFDKVEESGLHFKSVSSGDGGL